VTSKILSCAALLTVLAISEGTFTSPLNATVAVVVPRREHGRLGTLGGNGAGLWNIFRFGRHGIRPTQRSVSGVSMDGGGRDEGLGSGYAFAAAYGVSGSVRSWSERRGTPAFQQRAFRWTAQAG
jgi:hypothetical protein